MNSDRTWVTVGGNQNGAKNGIGGSCSEWFRARESMQQSI